MEEVFLGGERVFLKKSELFGWRVIYPYRIDGKINWKHLIAGRSWSNLLLVGFFVYVLVNAVFEVATIKELANACINNSSVGKIILP